MDNKYLNEVLDRLENYQKMMRQIELLQYEIQYASHVTPTEMIEVMTFQKRDADNAGTNGNHGSGREEITSCLQEGHARHEQSQQQQGGAGTVLIDELGDVILEVVDDDVLDGSIRTPRHKSISGFLHLEQDAQYGHDE